MTLTGDELQAVVNQACKEARAKANEADGLLEQRNAAMRQRDECTGALRQWTGVDAQRLELVRELTRVQEERDSRVDRIWVAVAVVVGLALGGVGGWALGNF